MATQTLSRIHAVSFGKVYALVAAVMGVIIGLIWGLIALVGSAAMADGPFAALGMLGIVILPILFAILYGILGFIVGVISAWIYNISARWIGGVKVDLE